MPDSRQEPQDFLGLPLWGGTVEEFVDLIDPHAPKEDGAARSRPRTIAYLNAHTANLAFGSRDPFPGLLQRSDLVYADGMAVVWAARWRGLRIAERVNAGDFLPDVVRRAAQGRWRVAIVGGRPGEAERAVERLNSMNGDDADPFEPCYIHHGFFESYNEMSGAVARLAETNPDLVLVGMGSPRQEAFMHHFGADDRFADTTFWCVGALFEYYSGTRRRAPVWMRRAGLEWLVRLVLEPGRLWRRYLIGNLVFIYRVLRGRPVRDLRQSQSIKDELLTLLPEKAESDS